MYYPWRIRSGMLEIFEIDLPSWKRRLYSIDSICARPGGGGGGGHLLAEWGAFEISQSLNFEHIFQGFLRQFEVGKKTGQCLDVFNNMAKKFFDRANIRETAELWTQKFVFRTKNLQERTPHW